MIERDGIETADVVIVGGGLNGPLLALALAKAGLSVALVDAGEPSRLASPAFDGRAYALNIGTRNILRALGLWAELEPEAQPIHDMKISHGRAGEGAGPIWLHYDQAEVEAGPLGYLLEDRFLRKALMEAGEAAPGTRFLWRETVAAQEARGEAAELTLAGGGRVRGRVLVGCDGRNSGTARRAGIGRIGWDYGQMALVATVTHERPHGGTAHQFFTPEGPLAILPLTGNRSSIVWTDRADRAQTLGRLDDDRLLAVLRPRFGDFLGEIGLEGRRYTYPLSLSLAEALTAPRLALVGDAAHGIHPLAGQGLNLGFRDVATLAEVLADADRRGEDIGSANVLERYGRWRRADAASLAIVTDGLNRIFSTDNPLLRLGRTLGMGLLGNMPALQRSMIRDAMGVAGDLPRLQRGLPL
jgi:2-octaprenyl-6-methoxyphenol hydroxylase